MECFQTTPKVVMTI